jgi:hypothetical protein
LEAEQFANSNSPSDFVLSSAKWKIVLRFALAESSTIVQRAPNSSPSNFHPVAPRVRGSTRATQARPEQVLKYLARYLTGGPISDRRLIEHQDGKITFWARSHDKRAGNPSKPYTLSGVEFTRRWSLHIPSVLLV